MVESTVSASILPREFNLRKAAININSNNGRVHGVSLVMSGIHDEIHQTTPDLVGFFLRASVWVLRIDNKKK